MPSDQAQTERRAPVIARHEMELDARSLRENLEAVDRLLGSLDWGMRRQIRLLLGHVAAQQLARQGPSPTFTIEIAQLSETARVDISMAPPPDDDPWHDLVDPHIEHLTVRWALDRRKPGGAWFEVGPESG